MKIIESIILGIVQGLTEFIPVSSSGHLAVLQSFFPDFSQPGVLFDAVLHLGTLTAVLFYFRKRFYQIIMDVKLVLLVITASVPTGVIGFMFKEKFEQMFSDVRLVGAAFIITGAVLLFADRMKKGKKQIKETTYLDALIIGLVQGIAIIPGISRSGSTISAGLFRRFNRKFAMEFSFLLSVPAILGAVLLQLRHVFKQGAAAQIHFAPYCLGFLAAAVIGYFTIRILLNFLQKQKLYIFSIYLWIVGTLVLLFAR
jgi:undecaprenyl-diphosphatase